MVEWCLEIQGYGENMQMIERAGKEHVDVEALSGNALPVVHGMTRLELDARMHAAFVEGYCSDGYFAAIAAAV